MTAHVSTSVYEGPIDLLMQAVSDHKLDIYDVPLAEIVDKFVEYLRTQTSLDLQQTTEFLLIAAILVEMKSRKLLPGPDAVESDEEIDHYEERDRLLARLLELQAYSAAADAFIVMIEQAARSVARSVGLEDRFRDLAPDLLADVTPQKLAAAYRRALTPKPVPVVDLSHVTVEAVNVAEAVQELETTLAERGRSTFRDLTNHCSTRMQIIVRFLALLELCKRGQVNLDQGTTFGELQVSWIEPVSSGNQITVLVDEYQG